MNEEKQSIQAEIEEVKDLILRKTVEVEVLNRVAQEARLAVNKADGELVALHERKAYWRLRAQGVNPHDARKELVEEAFRGI